MDSDNKLQQHLSKAKPDSAKFDVEKILLQIKRWQEKLLDTSKANPLLGLNRARSAKLQICNPSIYELFEDLVSNEKELRLPFVKKVKKKKSDEGLFLEEDQAEQKDMYKVEEGDLEFIFETPNDLRKKLRRVYDNARVTVEERGLVTLYLTFGSIRWRDDVLGDSISPIVMVPCELISKGPNAGLRLKVVDEEIQINPAVIYYFREKHKVEFPDFAVDLEAGSLKEIFKKIEKSIREQKWSVVEEAWLGTFTFESLVLYQDLKLLATLACSNPLVAAFAHASGQVDVSEALGDDLDSLEIPGVIPIPVLPVDSSQLKAVAYAAANQHLVIHGPPGTGKSQTISNIIADALGSNKKVLFVSAKMAALNVVFDRLKKAGLGQFCLEAHGTKAGKLKIIEELKRTLESEDSNGGASLEQELETLKRTREKLNEYVLTLHAVIQPFGLSVFQAIGRFAKLQKIEDIKLPLPWPDILNVTQNEFNEVLDAVSNIAQMADLFNGRQAHPWRGFVGTESNIKIQEQIEVDLKFLYQSFVDIDTMLDKLRKLFPKQNFVFKDLPSLIPVLDAISKVKKLPESWWQLDIEKIKDKEKVFAEASSLAKEFREKTLLYNEFCDLPPGEILSLLADVDGIFKSWTGRIQIAYFKWKTQVKNKLKKNIKLGYKEIRNCYDLSKRLSEIENWFNQKLPTLSEEVLPKQMLDAHVFEEVSNQCKAAILIKDSLPEYNWKQSKITTVDPEVGNAAAGLVTTLNDHTKPLQEAIERINGHWPNGFLKDGDISGSSFSMFELRAKEVLENIHKLRDWTLLQRTIKHSEDLNLKPFLDSVGDINATLLPQIFEKRFWSFWIDAAIEKASILSDFSGLKHQELIEKLRILDERIRRLANIHARVNAAITARKVKSANGGLGNGSEIGILRFEMQKRKRIKPLRKLFGEIPHVLQALKPCMLMSPVSVSTYLKPGTFHFDLVIFDEASQLPTPEAIPSILRANQVVVAGDPNQLPPTSFFNATLLGDENEDYEEEQFPVALESLLDDCVASVPVFQEAYLKWHYRSRDERLINFSNSYFYENKLVTFPSARTDNEDRGTRLEYLEDGVWDRGKSRTNRREARRAAQLAIEHFTKFPERSLGVVSLNSSQREAIEDALNEELAQRPELLPFFDSSRKEPFFVKSLESVQGDERDVIIISIGYAKSADGNLTLNFGPLNAEGGWRRLNVLVTRAKWQIILITSLRSSELHRINPQNRGALALKNFIEYTERGGSLPPDPVILTGGETNDFEEAVREVLVDKGYAVDVQVGAGNFRIDLGVRNPKDSSQYLIGIECDGATYHSSRVARDRDLLRQEILQDMGWKLHRVWSTEWFHNRDVAIKMMIDSIERAKLRNSEKYVPAPVKDDEDFEFKPTPATKIESKYEAGFPYTKYQKRHNRKTLMNKGSGERLEDILIEILKIEGPMNEDVLADRLKEVFNVTKIGANITSNIDAAIRSGIRHDTLERVKHFVDITYHDWGTFRIPGDDVKRALYQIPSTEISLAILYLVEDQFGMMRDQIPQAISKVFKVTRTSPEDADRIREITDKLVEEGVLVANGIQVNLK